MKKICILILGPLFLFFQGFSQTYVLNEDFDGTSGTMPPPGWTVEVITGSTNDSWYFDNPGEKEINFPITDPFAIFDSEFTSANSQPEEVALETPSFDASFSNYILLQFDHTFDPGNNAIAKIEVYDGDTWQNAFSFNTSTANPEAEIIDLSELIGGSTDAKLRFTWTGNGSGYWAVDNIRIYASLPLDGGLVSIDAPVSPVTPGVQDVEVTLGNFGYNTITSTTINWTADGEPQPSYEWGGSVEFGQTESGIIIGSYDFEGSVDLKIWQKNPNGQEDPNHFNDTITKTLVSALCGTYTIGGTDPDFETFSEVAEVLNTAGITCPVTLLVRDGTYIEQFSLGEIPGTSSANTVTFRSESGDSTAAVIQIDPGALKFEPMILLEGTSHVNFENLGLYTGSQTSNNNYGILCEGASHINIQGCFIDSRKRSDFGLKIRGGSHDIAATGNYFNGLNIRSGCISIEGEGTSDIEVSNNFVRGGTAWDFSAIVVEDNASKVLFSNNEITETYRAILVDNSDSVIIKGNRIHHTNSGVRITDESPYVEIYGNRIYNILGYPDEPEGTAGIHLENTSYASVHNNYIHTQGEGPVNGLIIEYGELCNIYYNSINISGNDFRGKSNGIWIQGSSMISSKNNIVNVLRNGTPVFIEGSMIQFDFDRNDYYSLYSLVGKIEEEEFFDLALWSSSTGLDQNSLSVDPFFTSDTNLSMNQVLLNNAGIPIAGIETDIDGTPRDATNPDIGAKEYSPCGNDAGINRLVNPQNPLGTGNENIEVELQNQGTGVINSTTVNWTVNGETQAPFTWNGNLAAGQNIVTVIGSFDFEDGKVYEIEIWTSDPNGSADCNQANDRITSREFSEPLCGYYTAGGPNSNYTTITEAAMALNLAGVSCPVTIAIADGTYREQALIQDIAGTSQENTVIFTSQSSDSLKVTIQTIENAFSNEPIFYLEGTKHIGFNRLGFLTGSEISFETYGIILDGAENVEIGNCHFEVGNERDKGVVITGGSTNSKVMNCGFESTNSRAAAILLTGDDTRAVNISGNKILGATDWGYSTLILDEYVNNVGIYNNVFERCMRAVDVLKSDSIVIEGNLFDEVNDGVSISNGSTEVKIRKNRFFNITSDENVPNDICAIQVRNSSGALIVNNFVHTIGEGACIGLKLESATSSNLYFNSFNVTNNDQQGNSACVSIKSGSSIGAKNNIFNIALAGAPVRIEMNEPILDFDRNDYFSSDKTIGFVNGNRFTDLSVWADSLDMDQTSFFVNPYYTSGTDLSINQALLNDAGIPIPGITEDIDSSPRDPSNPDVGAREYDPCPNDAGINEVISPVEPISGGLEEVSVTLQNQGSGTLTSATINWMVNEQGQEAYSWTGSLDAGENSEVTIGDFDFLPGKLYVIKVWTSGPNNSTDCNHINDTATSDQFAAPLCGTYTIGGADGDFNSFGDVAEVLNSSGVTCPVTFLVRDGIYEEKFILGSIPGSSKDNTVTFRSETGDSTKAIIRLQPGTIKFEPMILLEGAANIMFENLGLEAGAEGGQSNYIVSMEGAQNISFTNCHFVARNNFDYAIMMEKSTTEVRITESRFDLMRSRSSGILVSDPGTGNIEISGNNFTGMTDWASSMIFVKDFVTNLTIDNNRLLNAVQGIYVTNSDSIEIRHNKISNVNEGISIVIGCNAIDITQNYLYNVYSSNSAPDGTRGITAVLSDKVNIINNFVHTLGAGLVHGINLESTDSCSIYYNSVNTANLDNLGRSNSLKISDCNDLLIRNNILNVSTKGTPIFMESVDEFNLDYNNYYDPEGIIGYLDGTEYTSLFEWGQTVNGDANSMNVNSFFEADTVPLPYQRAINGAGIPVEGVLYDIDGILRNAQAPDMGCVEFVVDIGVLELVSPTLECAHPGEDSVTVYLHLFGHVPFSNLKLAWQLDNGEIHYDTIPGPVYSSITHTFEDKVDISAEGEYFFKIWLIGTLDDNINNDTLNAWRYSKPSPEVTMDYDNFCTGPKVYFFGDAEVESPYFIDYYEWIFGDGETSLEQNPVHTYSEPGYYEVECRAYSDAGCYGYTTMTVFIDPEFQPITCNYEVIPEVCYGDYSASIDLQVSGGYPPYNVYLNGEEVSSGLISGLTSGEYVIQAYDSEDCIFEDTVMLIPEVYLGPEIIAEPLSGITPLTVDFDFNANDPESWVWHFSDTDTSANKQASYTFTTFGEHEVILEVNSGPPYYCTETDTVIIFVDIKVEIEANNVFTPNNDGYNDFFEVRTKGVEELEVKIFSRWGTKVYVIDEVDGKWDGKTEGGIKAPDGTYFYQLTAIGYNSIEYNRKGSVLLLRNSSEAYPNPVEDNLKVTMHDDLAGPLTAFFYSVYGQIVHSETVPDANKIEIDISHLRSGIYILKITDGKRNYYNRIIKH